MNVARRGFVGGALAFGAFGAFGASGAEPRLKFGVMSDVHIGSKPDAEATAEKALRWFASENPENHSTENGFPPDAATPENSHVMCE